MKIGIITQPLDINFGGILQNYALQKVLVSMGHEVYTINRSRSEAPQVYNSNLYKRIVFHLRQLIKRIVRIPAHQTYKEYICIRSNCIRFVQENIKITEDYKNQKAFNAIINKYDFDAYVVGSDQIWRPGFSHNIYNDYLDFCQKKMNIKRVAYAASFGVNEWEYNEEQTKECRRLVDLFDAVSVREDSGVDLCRDYLNVDALHVLDPTLLLEKDDYIKLIEKNGVEKSNGNLFCYILDQNYEIDNLINEVENKTSLIAFQVKAPKYYYIHKKGVDINDYIIPSPIKWLRAFMDAKMVITDSFHGCVFSIIFNKPFWVLDNKSRGNARFDSLLKIFNLESRRIILGNYEDVDLNSRINWDEVNIIKKEWKYRSLNFLKENL